MARDLIAQRILCIGDGYRAKNSEMGPTGLPFARAGNIDGGFLFDRADLLDESNLAKAGEKVSRPSDIVFTSKGTVGRFAFVRSDTQKFIYSPQLCFWRVLDTSCLDASYLFYWMQSTDFLDQVHQVKGLTDMADYVSLSDQRCMSLRVPPIAVQRGIAAILSPYDDLIENNTRRIKILEEMAQLIYREWFVNFRFPGHENMKMVESELGLIPEGWTIRNLFDVANVTYGFPFKSKLFTEGGEGVPVIRIRDIKSDSSKTLSTEATNAKYEVHNGDLLVGMDGDFHMGKWAGGEAVLNQRVVKLSPKDHLLPDYYLFLALKAPIEHFDATIVGTTVAHLSDRDLRSITVLVPASEILSRLVVLFEPLFRLEIALKVKNANLRKTRDLLLPRLISGEVSVEAAEEAAMGVAV